MTYLEQCFEVLSCIGHGCFGVVFKVNSLEDGKLYAIKKSKERFRNALDKKRKLIEVERLEKIPKHPNCIQLHRAWEENGHLFLQLELCEVSLADYTRTHHKIPEEMLWNILTDITLALKHLHDQGIMHLDIKLDNILISNDGSFKLSDFGISLDCSQLCHDFMDGDARYLAPEVLTEIVTKSADIFSFGISIYELAYDVNLPQSGEIWQNLRKGQIPHLCIDTISQDLFDLMKWMMSPKPEGRPTADMILKDPHVKRIILKRKISHLFEALASSGKLVVSILSFFGKVGYGMVMNALLKLRPLNQVVSCPALGLSELGILGDNTNDRKAGDHEVVTSTPIACHADLNRDTPVKLGEAWEVSEYLDSSMDVSRHRLLDGSPSEDFFRNISQDTGCKRCKNARVHPYNNFTKNKCQLCLKKRCFTARNLLNDFSGYDIKD